MKFRPVFAPALALPLAIAAASGQASLSGSADAPAPVVWYRFSVVSGTNVPDRSGSGHDAEIRDPGRVEVFPDAPHGGSIRFDGSSAPSSAQDGFVAASGPFALGDAFSAAAWFRADDFAPFAPLLSLTADPDSWSDGFVLYATENGAVGANLGAFDASGQLVSADTVSTNEWHHVALVSDGAAATIYLDSAVAATGTASSATGPGESAGDGPFVVGSMSGTLVRPWSGDIADVRLYAGALSADGIRAVFEEDAPSSASAPSGPDDFSSSDFATGSAIDDDASPSGSAVLLDSDGDGMGDEEEIRLGRNPFRAGVSAPAAPILRVWTQLE